MMKMESPDVPRIFSINDPKMTMTKTWKMDQKMSTDTKMEDMSLRILASINTDDTSAERDSRVILLRPRKTPITSNTEKI